MSDNNNARNENIPENANINCPTFDYDEKNCPANRLYVSELPEKATPGIRQRRDESQELVLKFDWYFSTSESKIQSKEFSVPKSGKKFFFRACSSPWKEHGKNIEVYLVPSSSDGQKTVYLRYSAALRSPDWKTVEELSGYQEFTYSNKAMNLFTIQGRPVDTWPVDPTTKLIADMELIPRVYAIKGTLQYMTDPVVNTRCSTKPDSKGTEMALNV